MSYKTIILSPRRDFSELGIVTDGYSPECNVWVGDYPYLNKETFRSFIFRENKKKIQKLKQQQQQRQQQESSPNNDYMMSEDDNLNRDNDEASDSKFKYIQRK